MSTENIELWNKSITIIILYYKVILFSLKHTDVCVQIRDTLKITL